MVKEKIFYESANGKLFEDKEEAIREDEKEKVNQKRVANKYLEILNVVKSLNVLSENTNGNAYNLCNLYKIELSITDKEIMPEWYVDKPYFNIFNKLLTELNIKYSWSDGDERRPAYLKIYPSVINDIPNINELIIYIDNSLKEIAKDKEERFKRL